MAAVHVSAFHSFSWVNFIYTNAWIQMQNSIEYCVFEYQLALKCDFSTVSHNDMNPEKIWTALRAYFSINFHSHYLKTLFWCDSTSQKNVNQFNSLVWLHSSHISCSQMMYDSSFCQWESEQIIKINHLFTLCVKPKTDPLDQKDQCVILRQPASVNGIMNRHMSGWSMELTHCKRWAWGDMLSGRLPRFVLAWHSGGHGWAKWGRRNTYSQFPQIRGRSSLRRSQRREKDTLLWT